MKWSLPDAHTDFIIAVAAEEYGLICVLVIIALYTEIVVRSLLRLMKDRDDTTICVLRWLVAHCRWDRCWYVAGFYAKAATG